jgi:hypothetical protein
MHSMHVAIVVFFNRSNDPNESFLKILMAIAEIGLNDKTDDELRINSNSLLAQVIQTKPNFALQYSVRCPTSQDYPANPTLHALSVTTHTHILSVVKDSRDLQCKRTFGMLLHIRFTCPPGWKNFAESVRKHRSIIRICNSTIQYKFKQAFSREHGMASTSSHQIILGFG